MTKTLAAAAHAIDPTLALADVRTLDQIKDQDLSGDRFSLLLYTSFAAIALALAAIGIYGVMAFAVGERSHEIGVRMALGAEPGDVLRFILRQGMTVVFIGLALGLGAALAFARVLASMLHGVTAADPASIGLRGRPSRSPRFYSGLHSL